MYTMITIDETWSCDIIRTMYEKDSQGLSQLLDKKILVVGDSLFLRLEARGEYDFFSTIGAKMLFQFLDKI
jgi:hypothetical protein